MAPPLTTSNATQTGGRHFTAYGQRVVEAGAEGVGLGGGEILRLVFVLGMVGEVGLELLQDRRFTAYRISASRSIRLGPIQASREETK